MRSLTSSVGLAALLVLGTISGAAAGGRFGHGHGYGHGGYHGGHHHGGYGAGFVGYGYGYGGPYGFASEAVSGDYIGAPLTRFPRPSEIVPPAWGYGTYGVPTMTGIREAPTAQPSITVIDSPAAAPARRGKASSRVLSRDGQDTWSDRSAAQNPTDGGPRIVSVTVPRG